MLKDNSIVTVTHTGTGRWHKVLGGFRRSIPFISGVFAALVALLLYNLFVPQINSLTPQDVKNSIAQAMASATPPPAFSETVYRVIRPSLILIQTKSEDSKGKEKDGLGSGVVIDDQGDILTSLHVVDGASEIILTFADGMQTGGQVTASVPENDIAVLKPDKMPTLLVPAILGNPNAMQVGDEAYIVGNPFGLYSSMSAGVVSGFDRPFRPPNGGQEMKGLIQLDAAANPGNSGGPLLNRNGQVVGIVIGLANPTDQNFFVGISFAVPINTAGGAAGMPLY